MSAVVVALDHVENLSYHPGAAIAARHSMSACPGPVPRGVCHRKSPSVRSGTPPPTVIPCA